MDGTGFTGSSGRARGPIKTDEIFAEKVSPF